MTGRGVGLVLLLVGSLLIGIGMGEVFHRLFLSSIPPSMLSGLSRGSAHIMHVVYGAAAGLVMFIWAVLAAAMAPLFGARPAPKKN
ncbi:MAG: hypothetical protein ACRENS_01945 [Candidatus Eiseniibacteriota bacterium]